MANSRVKKSSQTPSSAEAVAGSRLAMTNARRHLRAAEALGDARLFGAAIGHLVLTVEESAKAWVLGLLVYGFDLPDDMLVSILRQHNARHAVTFGNVFRGILIFMADRAAKRVQKRHKVKGFPPELREEWSNELIRDTQSLVGRSARREPLLQALEWAINGSERKNKGFYVDYANGKWTHPGQVMERQFGFGPSNSGRHREGLPSCPKYCGARAPESVQLSLPLPTGWLAEDYSPPRSGAQHGIEGAGGGTKTWLGNRAGSRLLT